MGTVKKQLKTIKTIKNTIKKQKIFQKQLKTIKNHQRPP